MSKSVIILDYVSLVWKQMIGRKRRSWLTLLGVVIGISAIISLILIGSGLENAINSQLDALGADVLFISPKGSSLTVGLLTDGDAITEDDEEVISKVRGISNTAGMVYTTGKVEFNDMVRYFFVVGLADDPAKRKLIGEGQNLKIGEGRAIEKGDQKKVVVGIDYTDENLFGQAAEIGDKILIQDNEFKIVGFWERIGSSPDDRSVYMPLETYFDVFGNEGDLGMIMAEVESGFDVNVAEEKVSDALRDYRGLEEGKEDFNIQTPEQLAASFAAILGIVAAVLVGIATISLIVGGIGILNTMFTAVLQRTREIGLLKAIGARRRQILMLFLLESSMFGFVGGIIGVGIGVSFAKLVEWGFATYVGGNLFIVQVDYLFLMAVLVGSGIYGGICGYVPARRAAKADAVTSLRYE
jgi:putative ABC transport system permease protein